MKYTSINCLLIIRIAFVAVMLAFTATSFAADINTKGVRTVSCALYDITLPANWMCKNPLDASGMPPVREALLLDAEGGETKIHLRYQSWELFDINHLDDTQHCSIQCYILPSGNKPDFEAVKAMISRRQSNRSGSSKWIKIEQGYMTSSDVKNEGMKIGTAGIEKVVTHDRVIEVLREGHEYVYHLTIQVPESKYKSDANFRRTVNNVWKSFRLKK